MPEKIHASIACNLDSHILAAALPLFESEKVQAIEWSFDALFKKEQLPEWFDALLHLYAEAHCLVGHGVFFSLFSGKWQTEQAQWLQHLQKVAREFPFDHVTEHFGFMTGENFHAGAPMSIPFTPSTLRIGHDRLQRIAEAAQCPVGLENLAFACTVDEVRQQGAFLDALLEPVNGFIILDLHNLYCQIHNFDLDFENLIALYPLDRVREIHISGGSWDTSALLPGKKIRRDTHDDAVPEEVFALLQKSLGRCPNLKYVVLEQIGTGLQTVESRQEFQQDFDRLYQILGRFAPQEKVTTLKSFLPTIGALSEAPAEDADLYAQQCCLSDILENAASTSSAREQLRHSILANSAWKVEQWEEAMLETACAIAQKWKKGF
jgi:uncharacterized protein (UPF0276 family)